MSRLRNIKFRKIGHCWSIRKNYFANRDKIDLQK